jgi:deoxyribodipyrimidine photo-lyase
MSTPVVVWFRFDLRIDDHWALIHASKKDRPIIPIFIWDEEAEESWPLGGASKWWLHQALLGLESELLERGLQLIFKKGRAEKILSDVCKKTLASEVFFNRRYEAHAIRQEQRVREALKKNSIRSESFNGNLLVEPQELQTKQGRPYQVYTPYWRSFLEKGDPAKPLSAPKDFQAFRSKIDSDSIKSWQLTPKISWDQQIAEYWKPQVSGARELFKMLLDDKLSEYQDRRDFPAMDGTSRLSPYLRFGQLSPRRLWHGLADRKVKKPVGKTTYLKEIVWREFAYHLIFHFPHTDHEPLRSDFKKFPWDKNKKNLSAWKKGRTGYPIVDAGMRQLWAHGWMHNRVRMIVASFLVKHLLLPWNEGAKWFWDTLVDADLASNTMGWQWAGGCGADAAPYFRIFNPITQSEKFDAAGEYIRRWVPELKNLPEAWIHHPWEAPPLLLKSSGIELGKTYPFPIVDHKQARARALSAFSELKKERV